MKRIISIFIAILFLTGCISQKVNVYTDKKDPEISAEQEKNNQNTENAEKTENRQAENYVIEGIWIFMDTDFEGCSFEFHRDNVLVLVSPQITYTGNFSIDYGSSPVKLDLYIPEQGHVSTIIRFLESDKIEMANSLEGMARPVAFEDSRILVRIGGT